MTYRPANKAVFIAIEGNPDKTGYLLMLYMEKKFWNNAVRVTIHPCAGGSYKDMTKRAQQRMGNDKYDLRILFWDKDRIQVQDDPYKPCPKNCKLLLADPCIEGIILQLLGRPSYPGSHRCKSELGNIDSYETLKNLLTSVSNEQIKSIEPLNILAQAIQTGFLPDAK
jgi:hypothetical protein